MANYGQSSVGFVLVGGYNLLTYTTDLSPITKEAMFEQSDTLGDSWIEFLPVGVQKAYFTIKGFYDDDAASTAGIVATATSTERVVCLSLEGNTIGKKFAGFQGSYSAKFNRLLSRGGLHKVDVPQVISGAQEDGVILQDLEAKTIDWDTDSESVDNAALTSNGGAGYIQVTAYSGLDSAVVKIRHSDDDATYADLITFTTVTAGPTAERKTVSGTVNRHLLVSGDVTGTGSITLMVGFSRAA
jgi:hypothetical protein